MASNATWQGQERRSGDDRRTMLAERPEQECRIAERRGSGRSAGGSRPGPATDPGPATNQGSRGTPSAAGGSAPNASPTKDPDDWTTGDEPMTGPQRSYLHTLAREAGESVPDNLSKADASRLIDVLQARSGRGANPSDGIG